MVSAEVLEGFPGSSTGKQSACNARDLGSIPGLGRSLEEDMGCHGDTGAYSSILACRIPMDRGAWQPVPGAAEMDATERLSTAQPSTAVLEPMPQRLRGTVVFRALERVFHDSLSLSAFLIELFRMTQHSGPPLHPGQLLFSL